MDGWKTLISFWVSAYIQGQTLSFRECIPYIECLGLIDNASPRMTCTISRLVWDPNTSTQPSYVPRASIVGGGVLFVHIYEVSEKKHKKSWKLFFIARVNGGFISLLPNISFDIRQI